MLAKHYRSPYMSLAFSCGKRVMIRRDFFLYKKKQALRKQQWRIDKFYSSSAQQKRYNSKIHYNIGNSIHPREYSNVFFAEKINPHIDDHKTGWLAHVCQKIYDTFFNFLTFQRHLLPGIWIWLQKVDFLF